MRDTNTTTSSYNYMAHGKNITVNINSNFPSRSAIKNCADTINQILIEHERQDA